VGIDGVEKMSKSMGNTIGVEEPPREMFGKIMSISDELMWTYYTLLTDCTEQEIESRRSKVAAGGLHPRDAKAELAGMVVRDFHGDGAARAAAGEFERLFVQKGVPDDVQESTLPADGSVGLLRVLVSLGAASSNGEARRLIRGGGVSIDGQRVGDESLALAPGGPYLIQVGKRRFFRVRLGTGSGQESAS
jgi:tyrosyl-tRNA synthetase